MDWHFRSRSHQCNECEAAFEDEQPYHTILFRGMESLERRDICPGCWTKNHKAEPGKLGGYISHWQGVYEVPPPPPPEAIQKDNAETLLKKMIEQNDPEHTEACFILAVMLERKRVIKNKDQVRQPDGKRLLIYEHTKNGDVFTILDPALKLTDLGQVQAKVAELLEHGLNPQTETLPEEETGEGEAESGSAESDDESQPEVAAAADQA